MAKSYLTVSFRPYKLRSGAKVLQMHVSDNRGAVMTEIGTKAKLMAILRKLSKEYGMGVKEVKENPPSCSVKIYDQIEEIRAIKGKESLWPGDRFKHGFKGSSKAAVYGNPDGSLTIRSTAGKRLWKQFNYPERSRAKENPPKKDTIEANAKKAVELYVGGKIKHALYKKAWDEFVQAYAVAVRTNKGDFIVYKVLGNSIVTYDFAMRNVEEVEFDKWPPNVSQGHMWMS